uniref:Uncharacterized protein n=1 Tax=Candidatus Kentrum sp. FM TaxID=2126340 RepID=A0A450VMQ6_9GAMM|nr:MAG: hypothetical protein BECKFM1743A_GA0114220_100147 [Candidatus Kentron sp. FM]VFJ44526.1 MAG: hypothetical protein BECKFM1743C_GA0114222_100129 [Candidatus Kentron sp. FM]VFK05987.1 MAG: hypothetical protein BECKFM1743B_GA0114221_1000813 [Candidatus Kentron sp. FM]
MPTFNSSDAHSPWTNLGEVLGRVSQAPSDAFNAAFMRTCEIHDELIALAKESSTPVDDRIVAVRRFDPHKYTEIFPNDPKQWRPENYERYKAYRKRLDDWITAEEPGPAAELGLFAEHLDLLALHYQLGKELISRQELIDKVFGSYTRLRRAADRLPAIAGWSRRLTNTLNKTVVHYKDATRSYEKAHIEFRWYAMVILLVVLAVILALGLLQWQGIAKTQEVLRSEIQQGIADTREDAQRAVTKTGDLVGQFAALRRQFDGIEDQDQRIAVIQGQLYELQQEITRLVKAVENQPNTIRGFEEQLAGLNRRIEELERITVGRPIIIEEPSPGVPSDSTGKQPKSPTSAPIVAHRPPETHPRPGPRLVEPPPVITESQIPQPSQPPAPEPDISTSIMGRLEAMEKRQELLEDTLRWSEKGFAGIKESATALRDALKE